MEDTKVNKKAKELNRINNKLDKQINEENQQAFTDMICYIRGTNISDYNQEVVRQDLTEMVLSAQKRGENISSVIGDDYKDFCDNVIANLPHKTQKQRIIEFFDIICLGLSILVTINIVTANETITLIRNLLKGNPLSYNISFSIGSIISNVIIIIISVAIFEYITKKSFQYKITFLKSFATVLGFLLVFLMIAHFGKQTLFTTNIFIACGAVLVLYVIHKILDQF